MVLVEPPHPSCFGHFLNFHLRRSLRGKPVVHICSSAHIPKLIPQNKAKRQHSLHDSVKMHHAWLKKFRGRDLGKGCLVTLLINDLPFSTTLKFIIHKKHFKKSLTSSDRLQSLKRLYAHLIISNLLLSLETPMCESRVIKVTIKFKTCYSV